MPGGTVVTLTGTNFPPVKCASLAVCGGAHCFALGASAAVVALRFESGTVGAVGGGPTSAADFACDKVAVLEAGTKLTCTVATGVGAGLRWAVTVSAHKAPTVALSTGPVLFPATGYASPTIADLAPYSVVDQEFGGAWRLDPRGGDKVPIPKP